MVCFRQLAQYINAEWRLQITTTMRNCLNCMDWYILVLARVVGLCICFVCGIPKWLLYVNVCYRLHINRKKEPQWNSCWCTSNEVASINYTIHLPFVAKNVEQSEREREYVFLCVQEVRNKSFSPMPFLPFGESGQTIARKYGIVVHSLWKNFFHNLFVSVWMRAMRKQCRVYYAWATSDGVILQRELNTDTYFHIGSPCPETYLPSSRTLS